MCSGTQASSFTRIINNNPRTNKSFNIQPTKVVRNNYTVGVLWENIVHRNNYMLGELLEEDNVHSDTSLYWVVT